MQKKKFFASWLNYVLVYTDPKIGAVNIEYIYSYLNIIANRPFCMKVGEFFSVGKWVEKLFGGVFTFFVRF